MNPQQLVGLFERVADTPDAVGKLRQLVLSLAVGGKLLPQDSADQPAGFLLGVEQQRQAFSQIKIEQRSCPTGWIAVRAGNLISLAKGRKPARLNQNGQGLPYLDIAALEGLGIRQFSDDYKCQSVSDGDLIVVCDGSRSGLLLEGRKGILGSTLAVLRYSGFSKGYLRVLFKALYEELNGAKKGAAIPHLNIPTLLSTTLLLPPIAEQHRIVEKVDELMALCDQLDAARAKREAARDRLTAAALARLNTPDSETFSEDVRFSLDALPALSARADQIKSVRRAILNLAVRGKLVAQDHGDEPATALLAQFADDAARQEFRGRIRKRRDLSVLEVDQAPFALPAGWAWARFPDLGQFGRGKSKHRPRNDPALFEGGTHLMIQTGDVARSRGVIRSHTSKYNEVGLAQSYKWPAGTLCITIAANIADSGILAFDACFPDSVVGFVPSRVFSNARYFEYFVRTAKANLLEFAPATAQKNINLEILESVLIPLPPLNEQRRIVASIDELMALCDQIEQSLLAADHNAARLLDALMHEALEAAFKVAA